MKLQTTVEIAESDWKITHGDKMLLLGSCFADEVGARLQRGGFDALVNPFGTLYNPASIAATLQRCVDEEEWTADSPELLQDASSGVWHSWMHHTRFSSRDQLELVHRANDTLHQVASRLRECDLLIVTLGTAIIYRLVQNGMLVANCHKQPDSLFQRELLTPSEITAQWSSLLQTLLSIRPDMHILLTVSPIRHRRDGLHVNQVSKGILLQAVDQMVQSIPQASYFPAYEIMLDELRDYRFYADDMIHPSSLAVDYIWERFAECYMTAETRESCRQHTRQWLRAQHRPLVG